MLVNIIRRIFAPSHERDIFARTDGTKVIKPSRRIDKSINVRLLLLTISRAHAVAADVVSPITSAGSETGSSKVQRVRFTLYRPFHT